jgi:hypothetical protein
MIGSSAVGGFNGQIALTCSAPAGLSCAFNPTTISPGSSMSSSTLTVSAASIPPGGGPYGTIGMALVPGLFGAVLTLRKRKPLTRKSIVSTTILGLLLLVSLFAVGCGSSSKAQTPVSQVTLMVTGTSGSITHSSAVTVNIN